MSQEIKKYLTYFHLALFSIVCWYVVAELVLTIIWQRLWH